MGAGFLGDSVRLYNKLTLVEMMIFGVFQSGSKITLHGKL